MKSIFTLLISMFISVPTVFGQGYGIGLEAPDFADREVILVEYFTSRMVPVDTILLNGSGEGTFASDSLLDGGLYLIYFDQDHYFDFLIGDDQEMEISVDIGDLTGLTRFSGSENNRIFFDYKRFLAEKRAEMQSLNDSLASAASGADSLAIGEKTGRVNEEMRAYTENVISQHPDLFVSTFFLAMKDVEIPEKILRGTKKQQDSIRYHYYKDHYFDHFDVSDVRLLHTPIYEPKIKTYINQVAVQHPDSLINTVDMLIGKSRAHPAIFRYMLITLLNHFAESKLMGMDKVYFHIAEKYYIPEATWSSPDYIQKLKENLEKNRYTFINNPAPDFSLIGLPEEHFHMAEMDTAIKRDPYVGFEFDLYDMSSEFTILYFWEADCGHCKKSVPKLYEVYQKYNDHLQVLAVHVINSVEGKEKWINFVNEHQLYGWINCWSPFSNDFRKLYNLNSFPQMFILDEDKKIIAKNISPEQADEILGRFLDQ